ncbi:MAG: YgjP-like metallopeptidase domain-containing protein [Alteraurantiacibacter sp.]
MIDWLRGSSRDPEVEIAGRRLPVAVRRHPTAKRLTMRLAPDGSEVRVTMPSWGRTKEAVEFARSRQDWLAGQLARVPQALAIAPGSTVPWRGVDLLVEWQAAAPRKPALHDSTRLVLGGPHESIAARVRRWLEGEALALLADDLAFYCTRSGESPPRLSLSRAQRRWGSCSSERPAQDVERCIRINWRLVMAPDHVRRSVVAHEVAHLAHFNHSAQFHARLAAIFEGDIPAADRWLKQHGRQLYAAFG